MLSIPATLAVIAMMTAGVPVPQDVEILSAIEVSAINNQIPIESFKALMICESGGNVKAQNLNDPGVHGSRGIFQYQTLTFYETAKIYGLKDPDIWNPIQQVKITAFLLAQGKWNFWYNCSKKIGMIK